MDRTRRRCGATWAALTSALLLAALACAGGGATTDELEIFERPVRGESTPLGGEALTQRKHELARAYRDMTHFHATLESLVHRKDRSGLVLFSGFLDKYMGLHLDPLLRNDWQSRHPELMALDASLRLAKAEVLIALRDPGRVQEVLDDLRTRFEGREEMLVEYPIGEQSTLGEAILQLSERKWWRG
jgi:hypothetical protein